MTRTKQILGVIAAALSLSACGTMDAVMGKDKPQAGTGESYYYYNQTVPVSSRRQVDPLNTSRYSDSHLVQSSYLFK